MTLSNVCRKSSSTYTSTLITLHAHAQQGVKQPVLFICMSSAQNYQISRSKLLSDSEAQKNSSSFFKNRHYASNCLAQPMNVTNTAFLLTTPIVPTHRRPCALHNLAYCYVGKVRQQAHACCCCGCR
jgi:hypothetical protein